MRFVRSLLFIGLIGCGTSSPQTQTVTGSVTTTDAVAVRAVAGSAVVAATTIAADGSFALALPADHTYRLEVVTTAGSVDPVYANAAGTYRDLTFRVCQPGGPIDVGHIGGHHETGGAGSGSGAGTGSGSGSGSGSMGSGCGPGGGHGGHGSDSCDADPTTCGPPPGEPPCMGSGSDCAPPDGDPGMCPDHPPGDIGCGSGSGSG